MTNKSPIMNKDIQIKQFPRVNGTITPMLCYDDCIATFGYYTKVPYEKAYMNVLNSYFHWDSSEGIGQSYRSNSSLADNLKKYCGISITTHVCKNKDMLKIVKDYIDRNNIVCAKLVGFYCPWDWRYQIEEQGIHYFFLNNYNEKDGCFNCIDPYYQSLNEKLSYSDLQNGLISFEVFEFPIHVEKYSDIRELLKSVNSFVEGRALKSLKEFADKLYQFNIEKEVIDYQNINSFSSEDVDNIALNCAVKDIIHNRVRFIVFLKSFAASYFELKNEIIEVSDSYLLLSQKWESVRLMLIKAILVNNTEKIKNYLSPKVKAIVEEEEKVARKLIAILRGKYRCQGVENEEVLEASSEAVMLDITKYYNNEGIAVGCNNITANFDGNGEFLLYNDFPKSQLIQYKNWKFWLPIKKNGINDNIQCRSNVIYVIPDIYESICVLGCSEWGDYIEEIKILFENNIEESLSFKLFDWIPNQLNVKEQDIVIKAKKTIKDEQK